MNNILIIKLGAFGDIISNVGAIQDIRENLPHSKIHFLTTPPYQNIMEKCPWVDNVITTERKPLWRIDIILRLKHEISKLNIDMVVDLQCSSRTNLYYQYLFNHLDWCGLAKNSSHQIEKHPFIYNGQTQIERILSRCNISTTHTMKPDVSWMAASGDELINDFGLSKSKYAVLFFSCSANNDAKRWPFYKELAEYLLDNNICPVYLPGPDEIDAARNLPGKLIINPDEKSLSLFEVASVCKQSLFVIGNDTGPTHMAAFLQVPGLALFGNHPSNMTCFLEHSSFKYIKKQAIEDILLDEVTDHINRYFL